MRAGRTIRCSCTKIHTTGARGLAALDAKKLHRSGRSSRAAFGGRVAGEIPEGRCAGMEEPARRFRRIGKSATRSCGEPRRPSARLCERARRVAVDAAVAANVAQVASRARRKRRPPGPPAEGCREDGVPALDLPRRGHRSGPGRPRVRPACGTARRESRDDVPVRPAAALRLRREAIALLYSRLREDREAPPRSRPFRRLQARERSALPVASGGGLSPIAVAPGCPRRSLRAAGRKRWP